MNDAIQRHRAEHLSFIAHDLRNSPGAISLADEGLVRLNDPGDAEAATPRLLRNLSRNFNQLTRIVDDVLQSNLAIEADPALRAEPCRTCSPMRWNAMRRVRCVCRLHVAAKRDGETVQVRTTKMGRGKGDSLQPVLADDAQSETQDHAQQPRPGLADRPPVHRSPRRQNYSCKTSRAVPPPTSHGPSGGPARPRLNQRRKEHAAWNAIYCR